MARKRTTLTNNVPLGFITGSILPWAGVYLFFLAQNTNYDFNQFLHLTMSYSFFGQILSIGVIANLVAFFLFLNTNNYKSANGVILATFAYAIITLTIKYFL